MQQFLSLEIIFTSKRGAIQSLFSKLNILNIKTQISFMI